MATTIKAIEREVEIPSGRRKLGGILKVPAEARGVVAFAHGSGSGRFSPRNQFVARVLHEAGLATLLLDLLETDEAEDRAKVFDIELLADRLQSAGAWLSQEPATRNLPLGYFWRQHGSGSGLGGGGSPTGSSRRRGFAGRSTRPGPLLFARRPGTHAVDCRW